MEEAEASKCMQEKGEVFYTESFKRQVCQEYLTGNKSKSFLSRQYKIGGHSRILSWLRKFGYVERRETEMKKSRVPRKNPSTQEVFPDKESQEISRLKRELEEKSLESEMYSRMIDLAEQEFGISIRKK